MEGERRAGGEGGGRERGRESEREWKSEGGVLMGRGREGERVGGEEEREGG